MAFIDYNPLGHSWDCGCAECEEPESARCPECGYRGGCEHTEEDTVAIPVESMKALVFG